MTNSTTTPAAASIVSRSIAIRRESRRGRPGRGPQPGGHCDRCRGFPRCHPDLSSIAGHEGIGILDGRRLNFSGPVAPYGSMAQQVLVAPERTVELPNRIDDGVAVALGTAGMAGWLALSWRARLQPGETVPVLSATDVEHLPLSEVALQNAVPHRKLVLVP